MNRHKMISLRHRSKTLNLSKKSNITSIIALVVSILAFIFSLFQYFLNNVEDVFASQMRRYTNETTILHSMNMGDYIGTFDSDYEIIISNRSNNPISIISHSIKNQILSNEVKYTGMMKGFYDENGNQMKYINIDPHSTRVITVKNEYLIKKEIYEKIRDKYFFEKEYKYQEVRDTIYKTGTDLFGNSITYKNIEGAYMFSRNEKKYDQNIILQLITSKGKELPIVLYLYN